VTEQDIVDVYAVYLLAQRDYLRRAPGESYVMQAVKHGAIRQRISAWRRRVVAMDPVDLLIAEKAMARGTKLSEGPVRLPGDAVTS
jgi:hypothetical protein